MGLGKPLWADSPSAWECDSLSPAGLRRSVHQMAPRQAPGGGRQRPRAPTARALTLKPAFHARQPCKPVDSSSSSRSPVGLAMVLLPSGRRRCLNLPRRICRYATQIPQCDVDAIEAARSKMVQATPKASTVGAVPAGKDAEAAGVPVGLCQGPESRRCLNGLVGPAHSKGSGGRFGKDPFNAIRCGKGLL